MKKNFRHTICDPLQPAVIKAGKVKRSRLVEIFEAHPWATELAKTVGVPEEELHFAPSIEFENLVTNRGMVISAVGDPDDHRFHVFYKRPQERRLLFGLIKQIDREYTTELLDRSREETRTLLQALVERDWTFLDEKF